LRAPGHSQGAFGLESAIDELAEKLGLDPLEVRRKNEASPVRLSQYDVGAKAIGWERRNKKAGDMATGSWTVGGKGLAPSRGPRSRDGERQLVRLRLRELERAGARAPRRLGRAADRLPGHRHRLPHRDGDRGGRGARIDPADVTVRLGDTQFPEGPGSGGSTTLNSMAPAVRLAASQARVKVHELAAAQLGASARTSRPRAAGSRSAGTLRRPSPSSRPRRR
jgi:xanthine dehydrogenase YagR molybdenum-binding subunit